MTDKQTTADEEEYDDEKLHTLFDEISEDQKRLRKRPPKDLASVVEYLDGTTMSYIKDLAFYVREQDAIIQELGDRVEALAEGDDEPETQFQPEHALDLKILVTFAREQAKNILMSGLDDVAEGTEAHGQATMIVSKADAMLVLIEESTLEDADEEDEDEGEPTAGH